MPLLKRSAFALAEVPPDLKPEEPVFQIRFTKEIFRDYQEYLKRINLYRQKVWACKVTGKANLSYEQALLSESKASVQVQSFPKEFVAPVLRMVQFSPLCVSDLVDKIHRRYKDHFVEGEILDGVTDGTVATCKITRILQQREDCDGLASCNCSYDVAWLKGDGRVKCTSTETIHSLKRKKHPLTKTLLKSFIRESATIGVSKKSRWAVHDHLARLHHVPLHPSEEETSDSDLYENGDGIRNGFKRKEIPDENDIENGRKRMKLTPEGKQRIKYPIEDNLLPKPGRPAPHSEFLVPSRCVGKLLMVWDFCSSYSLALQISPYTLNDFQQAICYKEGYCSLLEEVHHALLKAIILTNTHLSEKLLQKRKEKKAKRKLQILLETWTDDLADLLELNGSEKTKEDSTSIRLGGYSDLEPEARLDILQELTEWSLNSSVIRGQLDEHIPRRKDSKKNKQVSTVDLEEEEDDESPVGEQIEGMLKSFKRKKKPVNNKKGKEEVENRCPLRSIYLGVDRDLNRYWFFPREPRIFVESEDSTRWAFYCEKEEFDEFCKSLNTKGVREKALKEQIDQNYDLISGALENGRSESEDEDESEVENGRVPSFLHYINKLNEERD